MTNHCQIRHKLILNNKGFENYGREKVEQSKTMWVIQNNVSIGKEIFKSFKI